MNAPQEIEPVPLAQRVAGLDGTRIRLTTEGPPIPANVIAAAEAALARGETHYTDRPGIPELRDLGRRAPAGTVECERRPQRSHHHLRLDRGALRQP